MEMLEFFAQWGIAGVVIAIVLWFDHKREDRMDKASRDDNVWIRDRLLKVIETNTATVEVVIETMKACHGCAPVFEKSDSQTD